MSAGPNSEPAACSCFDSQPADNTQSWPESGGVQTCPALAHGRATRNERSCLPLSARPGLGGSRLYGLPTQGSPEKASTSRVGPAALQSEGELRCLVGLLCFQS